MRILKRLLLMFFCFTSILTQSSFAGTAILGRNDDGSEKCLIQAFLFPNNKDYGVNLNISIKNDFTSDGNCTFPWRIKAFVNDDNIGYSEDIFFEDFQILYGQLMTVKTVTIHHKDLSKFQQECFTNECHELFSTVNITFKLFSGDSELTMDCLLFDDPKLIPNSQIYNEHINFPGCERDSDDDDQPINWSNPRGYYTNTFNNHPNGVNLRADRNSLMPLGTKFLKGENRTSLRLYPNPTRGELFIESSYDTRENIILELHSINGHLIIKKEINDFNKYKLDISSLSLPVGYYLVKVKTSKKAYLMKILILD